MTRDYRLKKTVVLFTRLLCLAAAALAMSARPAPCGTGTAAFFPDTVSTDTVVIASADSFITGNDTGLSAIRVGWTPGPVTLSHRLFEKAGISCITCHHRKGNDNRIKQCSQCHKGAAGMETMHKACGECHLRRAMDMTCTSCHTTPEKSMAKAELFKCKFSHVSHASRTKECRSCHEEPQRARWLANGDYPAMKTCLTCHDNAKSSGECSVCHNDVAQMKPQSHTYAWAGRNGHGLEANYNKVQCLQCHAQKECDRCHLGQTSSRIHTPGYRYTHGTDARMGVTNCALCHAAKNSCGQCHENRLR
jgi:hypothetical protein